MRIKTLLVATLFLLGACTVPSLGPKGSGHQAANPSSRCADLVVRVLDGVTAAPPDITSCFVQPNEYQIKTSADFAAFAAMNSHPSFYFGHNCGGYPGSAFGVDFLKGLYVYAYAVTIDPASYPVVFEHSIQAIGVNQAGLVAAVAQLNNSTTECPFDKPGTTV